MLNMEFISRVRQDPVSGVKLIQYLTSKTFIIFSMVFKRVSTLHVIRDMTS